MDIKLNLGELFDESDIPFVLEGYKKTIVRLMKEACRQVLELAKENAKIIIDGDEDIEANWFVSTWSDENDYFVSGKSITNTINQVE